MEDFAHAVNSVNVYTCVCVCVRACVRARVRACVCVCVKRERERERVLAEYFVICTERVLDSNDKNSYDLTFIITFTPTCSFG
jgi:hypothetical protein